VAARAYLNQPLLLNSPLVLQQILKDYQKGATGNSSDEVVRENLALGLGEFLALADAFSHKAESKAKG